MTAIVTQQLGHHCFNRIRLCDRCEPESLLDAYQQYGELWDYQPDTSPFRNGEYQCDGCMKWFYEDEEDGEQE